MNQVFADTSFWLALLSPRDELHAKIMEAMGIREALTCGNHFLQAGFTALLR